MDIKLNLSQAAVYVKHILRISISSFLQSDDVYADLVAPIQFRPQQLFPSAAKFRVFINELEDKNIYEITDRLDLKWTFICTMGWVTMLGPYRSANRSKLSYQQRFQKHGISSSQFETLQLYYNTFSLLEENTVIEAAFAIIKTIYGDTDNTPIAYIDFENTPDDFSLHGLEQQRPVISFVEFTHDLESRYMEAVSQGNASEAILLVRQIIQRTVNVNSPTQSLVQSIAGAAINRTEARIAAKSAGVPAPATDALTREFAHRALAATNNSELFNIQLEMTEKVCELVRQYRLRPYSPIIRKAIHYILLNLRNALTVEGIAKAVNVSPNYLSSIFSKEVGVKLVSYIQNFRLEKAAHLLTYTTASIQEICASVGIHDNNYFSKIFKKKYGKTPSEYR